MADARKIIEELVALKDLKEKLEAYPRDEIYSAPSYFFSAREDYAKRKPLAWAAARAFLAEPEAKPLKIWYMRDNHTFRGLPLNVEKAIHDLRIVFDGECGHYGMLCSKQFKDDPCHARGDWDEFEPRARAWLTEALKDIP